MAFEYLKQAKEKANHNHEMDIWRRSIPMALKGYDLESLLDSNWNGRLSKLGTATAREYILKPSRFLLLHGSSGLGKTVMGILMMDKFMEDKRVGSALYIDSPTLLYDLSYGDKRQENMIKSMSRPDILLIDDIGAGSTNLTDIRRDGIWSIVNNRWLDGKLTIITTNLPLTQSNFQDTTVTIQSWFGSAAWDRIVHELKTIPFKGESMRRQSFKTTKRK